MIYVFLMYSVFGIVAVVGIVLGLYLVAGLSFFDTIDVLASRHAKLTCWHCHKETASNKKTCQHCGEELQ